MKKIHMFVDNSNVKIEGARLAYAKRHRGGVRGNEVDNSYEIDWGKFLHLVKSRGNRLSAQVPVLYGSRPPPDDSIWPKFAVRVLMSGSLIGTSEIKRRALTWKWAWMWSSAS